MNAACAQALANSARGSDTKHEGAQVGWHEGCFSCAGCRQPIAGDEPFTEFEGAPYCSMVKVAVWTTRLTILYLKA